MLIDEAEDWDWFPACVNHLRFPPCRRDGECHLVNDPVVRDIVSDYQLSRIDEVTARQEISSREI